MGLSLFEDDEISQYDIAWKSKDWDLLQTLCDEFKEKPENEFFAILNDINMTKKPRNLAQTENYSKFMVDNMLSQHTDCIMAVNTMNLIGSGLSDQAHYNYYLATIPKGRRFSKSTKIVDDSITRTLIIKLLMKRYTINSDDAYMYHVMLNNKKVLLSELKKLKALVTDEMLKSVTKNVKEQKELKKKALEW